MSKEQLLVLRGRQFTKSDLAIVNKCVDDNYNKGRTKISQAICLKLNWKQPNGWLKDRACRDALMKLEELGKIRLPPAKIIKSEKKLKGR
jgi:cysteine synthase